jgi:putative transposase
LGRKKEERERGDARILGSGNFVTKALACVAEEWEDRRDKEIPVSELIEKVAFSLNMRPEVICSSSRKRRITEARALVCHFAINNLAYSASEVARSLSISRVNAGRCAERGKKVLDNYEALKDIVQ